MYSIFTSILIYMYSNLRLSPTTLDSLNRLHKFTDAHSTKSGHIMPALTIIFLDLEVSKYELLNRNMTCEF